MKCILPPPDESDTRYSKPTASHQRGQRRIIDNEAGKPQKPRYPTYARALRSGERKLYFFYLEFK